MKTSDWVKYNACEIAQLGRRKPGGRMSLRTGIDDMRGLCHIWIRHAFNTKAPSLPVLPPLSCCSTNHESRHLKVLDSTVEVSHEVEASCSGDEQRGVVLAVLYQRRAHRVRLLVPPRSHQALNLRKRSTHTHAHTETQRSQLSATRARANILARETRRQSINAGPPTIEAN